MKKIILLLPIIMLFVSCSNNEKAKEFLKSKENVSDMEIKDFQFKDVEMSDKEYFHKMADYHNQNSHDIGYDYPDAAMAELKEEAKYIDSAGKAKGDKKYKMTIYYKMQDKDTSKLGYLYFNDSEKLIFSNSIR